MRRNPLMTRQLGLKRRTDLVHIFVNKTSTPTCPLFKRKVQSILLPRARQNELRHSAPTSSTDCIKLVI